MSMESLAAAVAAALPGPATITPAGEGDYCLAYRVNSVWIFLVAKHEEATRSLERAATLLPRLAPVLPLAVPAIAYSGRLAGSGRAFVGYPAIPGAELSAERLGALAAPARERCARDLATFLRALHRFPLDDARRAGMVTCAYPFCASEDGIASGAATDLYAGDLGRLLAYPLLDPPLRAYCQAIVANHLAGPPAPLALLHNEVSPDHILVDPAAERLTGLIDFTGMIISDPARDLLYLYEEYDRPFLRQLLAHYQAEDRAALLARLHFYHEWHSALRLLWALDHSYRPGIARHLATLQRLQLQAGTRPWRALL